MTGDLWVEEVISVKGVPWVGDGGVSGVSLSVVSSSDDKNGEVAGNGGIWSDDGSLDGSDSVSDADGAWTEYVSGGVTLLSISSTKHKERPLKLVWDRNCWYWLEYQLFKGEKVQKVFELWIIRITFNNNWAFTTSYTKPHSTAASHRRFVCTNIAGTGYGGMGRGQECGRAYKKQ
nr:hypothetical protein [Tanacetum cinerariifolium]